jgi:uncharacterized SAM-binding protein YcdF (DUF218 family)
MTVLTSILGALVLSPFLFAVLLAAGILLGVGGRRKAAWWLLGATTFLLVVLSTGAFSSLLLRPLESRYAPWPADAPRVDAVVVLGGGVRGHELSAIALERLVGGSILARSMGVPIIVSGGTTWVSAGSEAEAAVAARVLVRLGMPESIIVTEGKSRTTWENAREVKRVLGERKLARVALVTSAWHMPRAVLAFRRAGVDCIPAPSGSLGGRVGASSLVPIFEALGNSFLALREYLGLVAYAARR